MAICPHCQTRSENVLDPCPSGDGYFCVEESDFAAHREDPLLGTAIGGRFVVLGVLGSGAMATVYRAHQDQVDRSVALKVFRTDSLVQSKQTEDPEQAVETARQRFAQEARVLGKLAHPNCVTIYDFGVADEGELLYIAMEHVGGISLRRAINRGLKYEAILEIAQQVLLALREAHALDIVHRDLKPENIILSFKFSSDEQVVKVVDFGIAKLIGQDQRKTRVGALFGTPAYMSPEQCRGDAPSVGPHSDIYALGCILYEIICGRLPYEVRTAREMVLAHIRNDVPKVVPRSGLQVPEKFIEFVTTCMHKNPSERYPDGQAALVALSRIIDERLDAGQSFEGRLLSTADVMRRRIRQSQSLKVKRVVVPQNQIAGVEIDPPTTEAQESAPTLDEPTDVSASDEQTVDEQTVDEQPTDIRRRPYISSKLDISTAFETKSGGGSAGRSGFVTWLALLALVLVMGACVLLFYYLYTSIVGP